MSSSGRNLHILSLKQDSSHLFQRDISLQQREPKTLYFSVGGTGKTSLFWSLL